MSQEVNLLHFIREITNNNEEFLAVIEEMNRWVEDEKEHQRVISMPHNIGGLNFTRDEYRQALDLASTGCTKRPPSQAIQNARFNKHDKQNVAQHRACENPRNHLLFYATESMDSKNR